MSFTKHRESSLESFLPSFVWIPAPASQGPEIRTGMLKNGNPVQLTTGQEVTITTDYTIQGDSQNIAMRYDFHTQLQTAPAVCA